MKSKFSALLLIVLVVLFDQLSKWAVMEKVIAPALGMERQAGFVEWLGNPVKYSFVRVGVTPFFDWVMVWNKGISFGMFQSDSPYGPYFMIALALAISAFFLVWLIRTDNKFLIIAISIVVGGALGNVMDRLRFGAVADFLDFHIGDLHWPAFNIADSCITLGIALIVLDGIFLEPGRHKKAEAHDQT